MTAPERKLTEARKKAIAFLKRPKPSLDAWWAGQLKAEAEETEKARVSATIGDRMPDGTIFAGLATDGRQIFAMPTDLDVTMTFNDAVKRVQYFNAHNVGGHNDWVIPKQDVLDTMCKNKDKGALANTFKATAAKESSNYPLWYWSSTECPFDQKLVYAALFSDNNNMWHFKDRYRLSCRPVRLAAPPAATP